MSPMKDENGRRLGTVLEWFDRTQEVATESELQEIIGAVTAGNLANRISLDGKRGFFLTLSQWHQRTGRRDRRRGRGSAGPGGGCQPGRSHAPHRHRGQGWPDGEDRQRHQRPDRQPVGTGLAGEGGGDGRQPRRRRDQPGQRQPLAAHRGAGLVAGRNRLFDGRDDQHGQAECRQRRPGQSARRRGARPGREGRRGGRQGREGHGRHQRCPPRRSPTSSA